MSELIKGKFQWPIVGHSNIVSYLQNGLNSLGPAHAYLFVGPENIGKTAVATHFVNSLVCQELDSSHDQIPCGVCQCCKQVSTHVHPDIFWIQREMNEKTGKLKKNISIEQIRELQGKLSTSSFMNTYKVAIISEAHTLSLGAANSLLKTLEEPTAKTVLILLSSNLANTPSTIMSRCQVLQFLPVKSQEIYDYLVSLKVEKKKAKTLAAVSYGKPGIALNFVEHKEDYQEYLEHVRQFISLAKMDLNSRFKITTQIAKTLDVDSIKGLLGIWVSVFRDSMLMKSSADHFVNHINLETDIQNGLGDYSTAELMAMITQAQKAKQYLDENVNTKLVLENLVLNF